MTRSGATLAIVGLSLSSLVAVMAVTVAQSVERDVDRPRVLQNEMTDQEWQQARADYFALRRGVDNRNLPDPLLRLNAIELMKTQRTALLNARLPGASRTLTQFWTELGPNPIPNGQVVTGPLQPASGRTISIAVHPANPNVVYVGTAQGGLYRSIDGGATWTPLLDSAGSLAINTVAIVPSQPDTVFAGTGEAEFSGDSFFGVGIYRIDNASTSAPIVSGPFGGTEFRGRAIGRIAVHPTDPNTIFVSSTSGIGGIGVSQNNVLAQRGLFRSTNALSGAPTFTKLTIAPLSGQDRNILDVVIDPGDPNVLLCTEVDSFNQTEGGVYRTANALDASPTFTRTFTAGTGTSASRTELAINRNGPTVTVYAASGFNGGTLQRSVDGGATFTQRIDNNFCGGQCFYDIAVAVDPVDADRVYLGGTSFGTTFAYSTNGGTSFTASESGIHTDSHVIAVAPSAPTTLYFGSDGGIYKSINGGASWASLNNATFRATQFVSLAVHPTDPKFTIGGTQDNGTPWYRPAGTWTRVDFGDGGYTVIDQNAADTTNVTMYHTYYNVTNAMGYARVLSTTNAADGMWTFYGCGFGGTIPNGMTCAASAILFYAPMTRGPGSPNTLYFGSDVLYRSANSGVTMVKVSQEPIQAGAAISAIGISPQNDNVRIVGSSNGGLWGTTTGSSTLTNLDAGNTVPNSFIARAVIDPQNVNTAYVTISAFGVVNVWKTTNLTTGPTWSAAAGSGLNVLPQVPVSAFIVDPANSNILYAGTDIGVYVSTDAGANWSPFGQGLPHVAVFDIAKTPGAKIRIATHGRGLWQIRAVDAPTMPFTDDPLVAGFTVVKAQHILELRSRIDAIRVAAGLAPYSYTDPASPAPPPAASGRAADTFGAGTTIKAVHVTDLRAALNEAYTKLGHTLPSYTDSDPKGYVIKAQHITELRTAVTDVE
jgi:hypothetical protein